MNGVKAPDPAFARLLLPLSGASRIRILHSLRDGGPIAADELRSRCGLPAAEVARHLRALAEAGLVAARAGRFSFVEPLDPLSRLFVFLASDVA